MTKWQKLSQFLHPEPEVVTDYGPKLLTNSKPIHFGVMYFKHLKKFIIGLKSSVKQKFPLNQLFSITNIKLVTKCLMIKT